MQIESIPMLQMLHTAVRFHAYDIRASFLRLKRSGDATVSSSSTAEQLISSLVTLERSVSYVVENRLPFRTESRETIALLVNSVELLLLYDQKDFEANHDLNDRIVNEALDLRIKNLTLLKRNLESFLMP